MKLIEMIAPQEQVTQSVNVDINALKKFSLWSGQNTNVAAPLRCCATLGEFTTWEFVFADANFLFHLAKPNKLWLLSLLY